MKVLFFAAMSLTPFAPRFAESTGTETQARQPVVQTAPVPAEVPGGCNTPVGERTSEVGCYLDATELLGELPQVPLFWHLYNYPTRAAAEAAKDPRGTVVESFERVWLSAIAEGGWHPSSDDRVAVIGPLRTVAGKQYTARYLEAVFKPGMQGRTHQHSGPEASYLLSGSQCLETPEGITIAHRGRERRGTRGSAHEDQQRWRGDAPLRATRSSRYLSTLDDFHERMDTAGLVFEINLRPTLMTSYV